MSSPDEESLDRASPSRGDAEPYPVTVLRREVEGMRPHRETHAKWSASGRRKVLEYIDALKAERDKWRDSERCLRGHLGDVLTHRDRLLSERAALKGQPPGDGLREALAAALATMRQPMERLSDTPGRLERFVKDVESALAATQPEAPAAPSEGKLRLDELEALARASGVDLDDEEEERALCTRAVESFVRERPPCARPMDEAPTDGTPFLGRIAAKESRPIESTPWAVCRHSEASITGWTCGGWAVRLDAWIPLPVPHELAT